MARIRSIKPEYGTSESVAELSIPCMMHFALLWTYADDKGRGVDSPRAIKGAIWPIRDEVTAAVVEGWQQELHDKGRIVRYEADGKRYFVVLRFREHQKPNRPSPSRLPAPPWGEEEPPTGPPGPPQLFDDPPAHGVLTESPPLGPESGPDLGDPFPSVSPHGALTGGGVIGVGVVDGGEPADLIAETHAVAPDPQRRDGDQLSPKDLEKLIVKALGLWRDDALSTALGVGNPVAYGTTVLRTALSDGTRDRLAALIQAGATPEDAVAQLLAAPSAVNRGTPRIDPADVERARLAAEAQLERTQQLLADMAATPADRDVNLAGLAEARRARGRTPA